MNTQIIKIIITCLVGSVSIKVAQCGPDNIAPLAKAKASSSINSDYDASKVKDGII